MCDIDATTITNECPLTHPYAYRNGRYCCETPYEHNRHNNQGEQCDGGLLTYNSACCADDKYVSCPSRKCQGKYFNK